MTRLEETFNTLSPEEKEIKLNGLNQLVRILNAKKKLKNSLTQYQNSLQTIYDKLNKLDEEKKEKIMNQLLDIIFPLIQRMDELKEDIKEADDLISGKI